MNGLQHLLIKLSEEASEVSSAVIDGNTRHRDCQRQIKNELQDLFSIVEMLNISYQFGFNIQSKFEQATRQAPYRSDAPFMDMVSICQGISKISLKTAQFGLLERCPDLADNNKQRMHKQLMQLVWIIQSINEYEQFDFALDSQSVSKKIQKVHHYREYSIALGCVTLSTPPDLFMANRG